MPNQLIENYKKTIRQSKRNISDTREAIRELRKTDMSYKDGLTIKAYQRSIEWNRNQIKECKASIRNIKIASGSNYWTWIVLIALCVILALVFPISIFTFAPIWGVLLIGLLVILLRTSR